MRVNIVSGNRRSSREIVILDGDSEQACRPVTGKLSPWLDGVRSALEHDYAVTIPDLSLADSRYETWEPLMDGLSIDQRTTLVGARLGANAALRWASENRREIGSLILVQPRFETSEPLVIDEDLTTRCIGGIAVLRTSPIMFDRSVEEDHIYTIATKLPEADIYDVPKSSFACNTFPELVDVVNYMNAGR